MPIPTVTDAEGTKEDALLVPETIQLFASSSLILQDTQGSTLGVRVHDLQVLSIVCGGGGNSRGFEGIALSLHLTTYQKYCISGGLDEASEHCRILSHTDCVCIPWCNQRQFLQRRIQSKNADTLAWMEKVRSNFLSAHISLLCTFGANM